MPFDEAKEQRPVWVVFNHASGAVVQVRYQKFAPGKAPGEDSGLGVLETTLSVKAIRQAHHLVVYGGRVRVRGSLARPR